MINAPNLFKQQPCRAVAENPISGNVSCSLCPSPKALKNTKKHRKPQEEPKKTPEKCKRRARFPFFFFFFLNVVLLYVFPPLRRLLGLSNELPTKAQPNGKRTQIFIKLTYPILGYLCYLLFVCV